MNEKERIEKLKKQLLLIKDMNKDSEIELVASKPEIIKQKVKKPLRNNNVKDALMFLLILFVSQVSFLVMMYIVFKK